MRRLIYLLILVMFVSASATCINASTDCERWFAAYKQELAHTRQVQRIAAAKRRARLYAKRKLAQLQTPAKPKLIRTRAPRMTRKETLHHFELACGIMPEDETDEPVIAKETLPPFVEHPLNDGVDLLPVPEGDLIAENNYLPPFNNQGPPDSNPSGGPPVYVPPFTGGVTPSGGGPGGGTTVTTPPPVTPPPATPDVPEPSGYVLMATGLVGAVGAFKRRFKSTIKS
jgi:hypothetical protein